MKNRFSKRSTFAAKTTVVVTLSSLFTLAGCAPHDNLADCPPPASLTVRAYSVVSDGRRVEQLGRVREVAIFVYDENEKLLGRIDTQTDTPVPLDFPGHKKFNIAALGNSEGDYYNVSATDGLTASRVTATPSAESTPPSALVDDLFHGVQYLELKKGYVIENIEVPIFRKIGAMNITVRGLYPKPGDTADDYEFVIRETYREMDFKGNFIDGAGRMTYHAKGVFQDNGDLFVDNFNLMPSVPGYNIGIDILYKGTLMARNIYRSSASMLPTTLGISPNVQEDVFIAYTDDATVERTINSTPDVQIVTADWGSPVPIWITKYF